MTHFFCRNVPDVHLQRDNYQPDVPSVHCRHLGSFNDTVPSNLMSQLGSSVCIFRRKSTTAAALEQHDYYCWPPPSPTGSRPAPLIATMACVVGASVDVRHVHVPSLCQVQVCSWLLVYIPLMCDKFIVCLLFSSVSSVHVLFFFVRMHVGLVVDASVVRQSN